MTENVFLEFANRIDHGIDFLNAVKPGWATGIELESFNLDDAYYCTLGQSFLQRDGGSGYTALRDILGSQAMINMGFMAPSGAFEMNPGHYENCTGHDCMECEFNEVSYIDIMQGMWEYRIEQLKANRLL